MNNKKQHVQNEPKQDPDFRSWQTCWKKLNRCSGICTDPSTFQYCLTCIKDGLDTYPYLNQIFDVILIVIGGFFVRVQYILCRNCRSSRKKSIQEFHTNDNETPTGRQTKLVKNKSDTYHQTHNQNVIYNIQYNNYYCVAENGQTKRLSSKKYAELVSSNDDNYNNNELVSSNDDNQSNIQLRRFFSY
eukprot:TRINITY_DN30155_c0_g1_i1.p1 TRINITY_DN30155_c0_g1~~TRINITY_DN30155_c0_g1_i1.p1  ORF type:complete len:188 (-),score=2.11 TRINITY_DN30155_c0_g1_i1:216-779(-)